MFDNSGAKSADGLRDDPVLRDGRKVSELTTDDVRAMDGFISIHDFLKESPVIQSVMLALTMVPPVYGIHLIEGKEEAVRKSYDCDCPVCQTYREDIQST